MGEAADRWREDLLRWRSRRRSRRPRPARRGGIHQTGSPCAPTPRSQAPGGASFDRAVEALAEPGSVLDVGRRRRRRRAAAPAVRLVTHRRRPVGADADDARRARRLPATDRSGPSWGGGPRPPRRSGCTTSSCATTSSTTSRTSRRSWSALTRSARRRVVVELPPLHPLTWMAPLWLHFHGVVRADGPDRRRRSGGRTRDRRRRRGRGPVGAPRPRAPGRRRAHHASAVPAGVGASRRWRSRGPSCRRPRAAS